MRYNASLNTGRMIDSPQLRESIFLDERELGKTLFAFGLNHRTAPVEVREKLHLTAEEAADLMVHLRVELSECLVLSTCNRTEIYCVSDQPNVDPDHFKRLLIEFKRAEGEVADEHFFTVIACGACEQAFKIATSVESKVVGDSQILKQLREAYQLAQEKGHTGKILNQLFQRALKLGKRTYTDTSIHDGAVSSSLAAVELAVRTFGSLQGRNVMVIGAGEMARLTAEALANKRVGKIFVTNRTRAHAEELVAALPGEYASRSEIIDFEKFKHRLADVDIVISSTGSEEPILRKDDLENVSRKILLVDIAVPRDIEPEAADNPNVILRNIDDLNIIIDESHEKRQKDLPRVRKMIVKEMVDFLSWYYVLPLLPCYEKTGTKPSKDQTVEVLMIRQVLTDNVSEIHRHYANAHGNFEEDLASHFDLVQRLHRMKKKALAAGAV